MTKIESISIIDYRGLRCLTSVLYKNRGPMRCPFNRISETRTGETHRK